MNKHFFLAALILFCSCLKDNKATGVKEILKFEKNYEVNGE
jgi:hypothetical protein